MIPVRAAPVFCAIETLTTPAPAPLLALVMIIQGTLLDAVHGQPATRPRLIVRLVAAAPACSVGWMKENEQAVGAPPGAAVLHFPALPALNMAWTSDALRARP